MNETIRIVEAAGAGAFFTEDIEKIMQGTECKVTLTVMGRRIELFGTIVSAMVSDGGKELVYTVEVDS